MLGFDLALVDYLGVLAGILVLCVLVLVVSKVVKDGYSKKEKQPKPVKQEQVKEPKLTKEQKKQLKVNKKVESLKKTLSKLGVKL